MIKIERLPSKKRKNRKMLSHLLFFYVFSYPALKICYKIVQKTASTGDYRKLVTQN